MRRTFTLLLSVILVCAVGCRRGGSGGPVSDGDGDADGDSDIDGTEDRWHDEPVSPNCDLPRPCPDDWFLCSTQDDGEISCEGQLPVTPDRGEWYCDVVGSHALERAMFLCRGSTLPTSPEPWVCSEGEYSNLCLLNTYWPDAGEGPFWDCAYMSDRIYCSYEEGDPAVCNSSPCPDNWFVCTDYGDGETSCESAHPASPDRGEWYCEIEGGHALEDAIFVCNGSDMPIDPGAWSCEEGDMGGIYCVRSAYWPDLGDDSRWACSYAGEGLFCSNAG